MNRLVEPNKVTLDFVTPKAICVDRLGASRKGTPIAEGDIDATAEYDACESE
jgi:hypothetical protein